MGQRFIPGTLPPTPPLTTRWPLAEACTAASRKCAACHVTPARRRQSQPAPRRRPAAAEPRVWSGLPRPRAGGALHRRGGARAGAQAPGRATAPELPLQWPRHLRLRQWPSGSAAPRRPWNRKRCKRPRCMSRRRQAAGFSQAAGESPASRAGSPPSLRYDTQHTVPGRAPAAQRDGGVHLSTVPSSHLAWKDQSTYPK